MNLKDITLLSVSFNNNLLTGLMLKSLNKQLGCLPNCLIIDNGTTEFIDNNLKSIVNVLDNRFQHITGNYRQCSKNHCSTIDYALKNLIKTKWCLLVDNDILFKPILKSFIENLNENEFDTCGEIGWDDAPPERLFPYFCLINVEKFKIDKLNYFDNYRCIGPGSKEIGECGPNTKRWYKDTGCSFLEDIKNKWKIKIIKMSDYIVHKKSNGYGFTDQNTFLTVNKELYI